MGDLARRIAKLELAADVPPPPTGGDGGLPRVIIVRGGVAALDRLHAVIAGRRLDAEAGELLGAFEARALELATEAHAPFVIVAGLRGRGTEPPEIAAELELVADREPW